MKLIEFENVTKAYHQQIVFKSLNLAIEQNDFVIICGESASGKTTLLKMIYGLEKHDKGKLKLSDDQQAYLTRDFKLINGESVKRNLKYVCRDQSLIKEALEFVDLDQKNLKQNVDKLSGCDRQKVAIARSYLQNSQIVLCDEPTGNLDKQSTLKIMNLLSKMHREGKTIIMATQDHSLVDCASKVVRIEKQAVTIEVQEKNQQQ